MYRFFTYSIGMRAMLTYTESKSIPMFLSLGKNMFSHNFLNCLEELSSESHLSLAFSGLEVINH